MLAYVQIYAWRRKTNTSDAKLDFSYAYAQMRRSEQAFTIVCYKFGCCATSREVDSIVEGPSYRDRCGSPKGKAEKRSRSDRMCVIVNTESSMSWILKAIFLTFWKDGSISVHLLCSLTELDKEDADFYSARLRFYVGPDTHFSCSLCPYSDQ